MNWYLEIEIFHGTIECGILMKISLLNFSFEDGFECVDEALQEIKTTIFRILEELVEWVQPDQSTQLHHALDCYNLTTKEEEYDDTNKFNILESQGQQEVEGHKRENPDVTEPPKTQQVNIGFDVEPNFSKIGNYLNEDTVDNVDELLCKYQDLVLTKFLDMNGIIGDLGIMKITLKPNAKPVKQRPYWLNSKYK